MFERCWPVANTDLMDAEQRKQLELNVGQVRAFMRLHSLKDRALMVDLQRSDLQLARDVEECLTLMARLGVKYVDLTAEEEDAG
jgi:hypothetical protein